MKKYTNEELKNLNPVDYAKEWNAARLSEGKGNFTLPEDPEFYADMGYETAYDYEKGCAASTLSDVFKEINGWRPRGMYPIEEMSLEDIEEEVSRLIREEEARQDARRQEEARIAAKIAAAKDPSPLTFNPFVALKGVC